MAFIGLIGTDGPLNRRSFVEKLVPRWEESSLVIGPRGSPCCKATSAAKCRWDELRDLPDWAKARPVSLLAESNQNAWLASLQLVVAGAVVHIFDIYDRPLPSIAKIVRQFWGQPAGA